MKGILGRKIGMTQLFSEAGKAIAITIIHVEANVVSKVLNVAEDGYQALQLGVFKQKKQRQKRPQIGHFQKAKTEPKVFVKEIRNMQGFKLGDKIDLSIFQKGEYVDISAISKGKGFAGTIKRHNQKIGPKSHGGGGGSKPVRLTGSLGDISGNKVFKGMTMPGQMGAQKRTVQNLEIVNIDLNQEILLVAGSVPGPKNAFVIIHAAKKLKAAAKPFKLVDRLLAARRANLLTIAQSYNLEVAQDMEVEAIQKLVDAAKVAKGEI